VTLPVLATAGRLVSETCAEFGPVQPDRDPGPLGRRYTNDASAFLDVRNARVPRVPAAQDPNSWDEYDLAGVSVPALFQWGVEDGWLPVSFGRDLAAQVDDHRFVTHEAVGHAPMEETPGRTTGDAAEFLRE
jgi:pimeloyl-ACP methyl ester carboxylesterase